MNLLLVEDEQRVADFIQRGLRAEGWSVTVAPNGDAALELVGQDDFDVIVLDLVLPGISGQDVCRRLRARGDKTPVLMLSALDRVDDRVSGLRMGADDYLVKPFDFDELVARIEALSRRAKGFGQDAMDAHVLSSGALRLDTRSFEVTCHDEPVELSAKERDILRLLLTSPDRVHSRERILNTVWGAQGDPLTNVVDVYISRLRRKLGPAGEAIQTVRGAGYCLRSARSGES